MRPERYGNAEFDDGERYTTVRPRGKQPSKSKFHPIGYKRTATKTPPRMQSSDSSSESSGYQDESDDDGDDKGPTVIDISKKKNKMPSKIQPEGVAISAPKMTTTTMSRVEVKGEEWRKRATKIMRAMCTREFSSMRG
jgi:hypothetical protein